MFQFCEFARNDSNAKKKKRPGKVCLLLSFSVKVSTRGTTTYIVSHHRSVASFVALLFLHIFVYLILSTYIATFESKKNPGPKSMKKLPKIAYFYNSPKGPSLYYYVRVFWGCLKPPLGPYVI